MANVFDFRSGRSLRNINPQEVGEELERIRTEKGKLIPADVLDAARDEHSPMHAAFEWDNDKAAEVHRLGQARRLITSIRILNSPAAQPTVAYVSVKTPGQGRQYVPTIEALSDEELRARVMMEVRQFIEGMERRYAHFREVAALLDGLKKQVG